MTFFFFLIVPLKLKLELAMKASLNITDKYYVNLIMMLIKTQLSLYNI